MFHKNLSRNEHIIVIEKKKSKNIGMMYKAKSLINKNNKQNF